MPLGTVFSLELLEERSGYLSFQVDGPSAFQKFEGEAGGHRWQRIPPTERRGRYQTSTITVAVLKAPNEREIHVRDCDLDITTCRDSGPGGQHRNKTESAIQLMHKPTGIQIRCCAGKSQHQNRKLALNLLRAKLAVIQEEKQTRQQNGQRRNQIGSGMRGDKIRTIQVRHNLVVNHRTGREWSYDAYTKGIFTN